jgi:hypothetical protein
MNVRNSAPIVILQALRRISGNTAAPHSAVENKYLPSLFISGNK